jgi:Xaa-Pro aminopeptidase
VSHVRAYDGVINYSSYMAVTKRLPDATFEDATDVVGFARYVKSDEEIECARRASEIAVAGIDEMTIVARPGVSEAQLYARVTARMMELGGEHHNWAIKTGPLGSEAPRFTDPPTGRRLQEGTYITNEVDAVWGGIVTQEDQPILLGPIPEEWKPVLDLHRSVFEGGLSYMRPGVTFAELIDYTNEFGSERGMQTRILMSGRGVGDDGPLITPRIKGEHIRDLRLARGNVFVWKPYAMSADGRISFTTGGAAVVTDRGAELLVPRQHGMVSNV